MKERGMIFSGASVLAILENRKFQTRRVVKPPRGCVGFEVHQHDGRIIGLDDDDAWVYAKDGTLREAFAPAVPGDRVYVKEAAGYLEFAAGSPGVDVEYFDRKTRTIPSGEAYRQVREWKHRSQPAMFMPRWASRLTLEITDVRWERVQDISEEDAIAEGFENRWLFSLAWDAIHGHGAWERNDWVWPITFRRVEG